MRIGTAFSVALTLLLPLGTGAQDLDPPAPKRVVVAPQEDGAAREVQDCIHRNIPTQSSVQTVEFTSIDRVGGERVSRAKIYGKKLDDGFRRLKLRFTKPLYMRQSELLLIETDSSPDAFLYTPELRRAKRVSGGGGGGTLFGTDFTYEDFERWQLFNQPGESERRADAEVANRPVYVLFTYPAEGANSEYVRVETFVHKETCVILKIDSYEKGERLRKVLTADPESLLEEGGIWVATQLEMRDIRDETQTLVVVEDLEVDQDLKDNMFSVGRMGRRRD